MLYQVLARDSVIKNSMPQCSIPWGFLLYAEEEEKKAGHYSSRIVFDVKEVFMLYSENIQYHIK